MAPGHEDENDSLKFPVCPVLFTDKQMEQFRKKAQSIQAMQNAETIPDALTQERVAKEMANTILECLPPSVLHRNLKADDITSILQQTDFRNNKTEALSAGVAMDWGPVAASLQEALQAIPEGGKGWLQRAQQCTVRVGVYKKPCSDEQSWTMLNLGSGALLRCDGSSKAEMGTGTAATRTIRIATAAHVLNKWREAKDDRVILVGMIQPETGLTKWTHTAAVLTSDELLSGALDIAVLQLQGTVKYDCPSATLWTSQVNKLVEGKLDDDASLPFLRICDTSQHLRPGDEMWAMGYPPRKVPGLMVERGTLSNIAPNGWLIADMARTMHAGCSGGPALNEAGQLIGIMSNETQNLARFQNISLATKEHGMPQEKAPAVRRWREAVVQKLGALRDDVQGHETRIGDLEQKQQEQELQRTDSRKQRVDLAKVKRTQAGLNRAQAVACDQEAALLERGAEHPADGRDEAGNSREMKRQKVCFVHVY